MVEPNHCGISAVWDVTVATPDVVVGCDTSGSWGCGANWLRFYLGRCSCKSAPKN